MWVFFTVALSLSSQVFRVEGFGLGAPPSKCGDMMPSHGGTAAQSSAIPYTLTSASSTYTPGEQITLTLGGGSFNGYLIVATDDSGNYLGTMSAPAGSQTVSCGANGNEGLTHNSKVTKTTVNFEWDAPSVDSGDITFYATVVQNYVVFWVRQPILTISPEITAPITTSIPLPQTSFVSPQLTTESSSLTPQTTTQITIQVNTDALTTMSNRINSTISAFVSTRSSLNYVYTPLDSMSHTSASPISAPQNFKNGDVNQVQKPLIPLADHTFTNGLNLQHPRTHPTLPFVTEKHTPHLGNIQSSSTIQTVYNDNPSTTAHTKHTGYPSTSSTMHTRQIPKSIITSVPTNTPSYYNNHYPGHLTFSRLHNLVSKPLDYETYYQGPSSRYDHLSTDKYSSTYPPLGYLDGQGALHYDYPFPNTATNTALNFDYDNYTNNGVKELTAQDTYYDNHHHPQTLQTNDAMYPDASWNAFKAPTATPGMFNHRDRSTTYSTSRSTESSSPTTKSFQFSTNEPTTTGSRLNRMSTTSDMVTTASYLTTSYPSTKSYESFSTETTKFTSTVPYTTTSTNAKSSHSGVVLNGASDKSADSSTLSNQPDNTTVSTDTLTDTTENSTDKAKNADSSKKLSTIFLKSTDRPNASTKSTIQLNDSKQSLKADIPNDASSEAEYTSGLNTVEVKPSKDTDGMMVVKENESRSNIGIDKELRIRPWGISHVISHGHNLVKVSSPKTSTTTTKEVKRTTPAQDNTPRKLSVQGGNILYDDDCGSSKGCFVKCSDRQCEFMVTWRDVGSGVQFEIYGRPNFPTAWVAVGFSDDTRMGDDSVVECVAIDGLVQIFNSENIGYSNRRMNPAQMGLSSMYGTYNNGILYCTFVRQKFMPSMPSMHNLEDDWNIMYADGQAFKIPAWTLNKHDTNVLPPVSASRVDFQHFGVIGSGFTYKLVKAHGCLMILAWVLFTGIGIVVARYYKNVWGDKTFLKLKIWFQIHRACMVMAVILNVLAFVIIFIDVEGYSEINVTGKAYLKSHPVLGIIVTGLCLANPIMAIFRPGPDSNKRPIFNWAHWGVGMTAYILSAICICFGFQLGKSSTPDYAIYIMIVYILHIIIYDVVFEVIDCMQKRQKKAKVENVEMSTQNGTTDTTIPNGRYQTKQSRKSEDRLKTALLLLHIAFTGAFALVLVLVVALN